MDWRYRLGMSGYKDKMKRLPKNEKQFFKLYNLGGAGNRTPCLSHAKRALYHMSYTPIVDRQVTKFIRSKKRSYIKLLRPNSHPNKKKFLDLNSSLRAEIELGEAHKGLA